MSVLSASLYNITLTPFAFTPRSKHVFLGSPETSDTVFSCDIKRICSYFHANNHLKLAQGLEICFNTKNGGYFHQVDNLTPNHYHNQGPHKFVNRFANRN